MPLFEYSCSECGYRFEVLIRGSSKPPAACPRCSRSTIKRELSPFFLGAAAPQPQCAKCSEAPACPYGGSCGQEFDD